MTETAASQHNEQRATALLGIAEELVLELSLKPRRGRRDRLDLSLAQDWGFDSLSRAELLLRIEPAFATSLPSRVLHDAGTLRDVLAALGSTAAVPLPAATPGPSLTDEVGAEPAPDDAATLLVSIPEAAGVTTLLRLQVDSLRGVATVSELAVAAGPPAVGADLRLA
ncbi:MAG: acyl carrier protein [Rhodopila sp.]